MSYDRATLPLPSTDTGGDKMISVQRDVALVVANKLGQTSTKYLGGYGVFGPLSPRHLETGRI